MDIYGFLNPKEDGGNYPLFDRHQWLAGSYRALGFAVRMCFIKRLSVSSATPTDF